MTDYVRLPRTYFVPADDGGARVYVSGCSFFLSANDITEFVDWLLADRPDPMPARRAVLAARNADQQGSIHD